MKQHKNCKKKVKEFKITKLFAESIIIEQIATKLNI
jgi:DNA-binding CsgD family transcriptional regulator